MAAKKPQRSIRLEQAPAADGIGILSITQRKKSQYYIFREIPCEIGGRGFIVQRLGQEIEYHVRIGATEECSCECRGFLAHSHCRHIMGLLALDKEGVLP
jgi:hypothetical protein